MILSNLFMPFLSKDKIKAEMTIKRRLLLKLLVLNNIQAVIDKAQRTCYYILRANSIKLIINQQMLKYIWKNTKNKANWFTSFRFHSQKNKVKSQL